MPVSPPELRLEYPACLAADFAREFPHAERATAAVLGVAGSVQNFVPLEERSPGLKGNDWSNYLRCSEARLVHAARLLHRHGVSGGRVLDYGAYFGNFALMFRDMGFTVDAVDAYRSYAPSLDAVLAMLRQKGIGIIDFDDAGRDLAKIPADSYDVVLCMGVIEHIPHTPRLLLESLRRVLKPGGTLVMDTPNFTQLPNRQKFARGESVMTSIPIQFHATIPFEGHHREYTVDEMSWMVQEAGLRLLGTELYNYTVYGHGRLIGRDVTNHWRMVANPTMRELVMVAARRPAAGETPARVDDWRAVFEDPERYWIERMPASVAPEDGDHIVGNELLLVDLQEAVTTRDRMLADLQAERTDAVRLRDTEISRLNERLGALQHAFDMTPGERLKRAWRKLTGGH